MNIFYITRLDDIINTVFSNIETNISMSEVLKMSNSVTKIQADSIQTFGFRRIRIDGHGTISWTNMRPTR